MQPDRKEKATVKIISEIAKKYNLALDSTDFNYNIRLRDGSNQAFIFDSDFGLNSATTFRMCRNKTVTANILALEKIPHIEHKLFVHPGEDLTPHSGTWEDIQNFCRQYNYNVVIKSTNGSRGIDVFHASNRKELEVLIHNMFSKMNFISISKYYDIKSEYRILILNNKPDFSYRKVLPSLIGDGTSDVKTLFIKYIEGMNHSQFKQFFKTFDKTAFHLKLEKILSKGEKYPLHWKFNVYHGALIDLHIEEILRRKLDTLAIATAKALDLKFGTVDIVEVDNDLKVLEVNTGIAMSGLIEQFGESGINIARKVFEKAICLGLSIDQK